MEQHWHILAVNDPALPERAEFIKSPDKYSDMPSHLSLLYFYFIYYQQQVKKPGIVDAYKLPLQ